LLIIREKYNRVFFKKSPKPGKRIMAYIDDVSLPLSDKMGD
jgi:hypothetical protein